MNDARAEVLGRIRTALSGDVRAPGPSIATTVERRYLGAEDTWENALSAEGLLALLAERIVDYRASVTAATPDDVAEVVAGLVAGASRVVVPAGFDRGWLAEAESAGVEVVVDSAATPVPLDALDTMDAVVTGSRLAIAETGTIVLDGGPDQGRRAISLVPDHHVCVVSAEAVVRGLPAAMRLLDITRPLTWISGPSATSDIELSRVEGVHGPRRLDVVLLHP